MYSSRSQRVVHGPTAAEESVEVQSAAVSSRSGRGDTVEANNRPVRWGTRGLGSPWYDDRSLTSSAATGGAGRQQPIISSALTTAPRRGVPWNSRQGNGSGAGGMGYGGPIEMGIRSIETYADYTIIETVEIVKRPGQTLGFYIREGNGIDRASGVFISRIAPCSIVEKNGLLRVGEEIIAVDGVEITNMSLDDVVILMSLPRRLLLTVKTRKSCCSKNLSCPTLATPPGDGTTSGQPKLPGGTMLAPFDGVERGHESTLGRERRPEHQRHWSTASVVDLTDNYAEKPSTTSLLNEYQRRRVASPGEDLTASLRRRVATHGTLPRTGAVQTEIVVPVEVHHEAQRQMTPGTRRRLLATTSTTSSGWDRRNDVIARNQITSAGAEYDHGLRRPLRYPLDYSSDTEAPYVGQLLPAEWRRPPSKPGTGSGHVKVEIESATFEQEWPPTVNGKRRRRGSDVNSTSGQTATLTQTSHSQNGGDEELSGATKRHISDSDLNGGSNFDYDRYLSLLSDYSGATADRLAQSRLGDSDAPQGRLGTGNSSADKSNSLPEIENGNGSGSGSSKSDELRHWLRKLDNLSIKLQEFNHRGDGSGSPQYHNESHSNEPQRSSAHHDVTAAAAVSRDARSQRRHVDDVAAHRRFPSAPETYTASEYRTWSRDRHGRSVSGGGRRRMSADTIAVRLRDSSADGPVASELHSSSASHRLRLITDTTQGTSLTNTLSSLVPDTMLTPVITAHTQGTSSTNTSASQGRRSSQRRMHITSSGSRVRPEGAVRMTSAEVRNRVRTNESTSNAAATSSKTPLMKQPLKIKSEDFRPYRYTTAIGKADRRKPETEQVDGLGLDGVLSVHVFCGYGLRIVPTVLRNLYCVINIDNVNRARTAVQSGAVNFDWDEVFDIDVVDARAVTFSVYSWSSGTKQRLHFNGTVDLTDCNLTAVSSDDVGMRVPRRLALRLEPTGILYVELSHGDLSHCYRRSPAPSSVASVAAFGIDLNDLVARERPTEGTHAGHLVDVPAIVRRCVDEVERRGLEAVGIYRLCCGARRKRQLKAELEADVIGVTLTAQRVPDINVITCVLKDFFIELPEPLFTNGLYQLLMDAMSVQIASDPRGNAAIMFGIIDCLPRVNQATLTFMLDHLKRVSRKSDVNKMTSSALARVFGPLFICPPYRLARQVPVDLRRHAELLCYVLDVWPSPSRR